MELTVTVYNINYGCNEEIMDACRTLKEYTIRESGGGNNDVFI